MQLKKFSSAAQRALVQCRGIAKTNHNPLVEPEHLALALIRSGDLELLGKKNLAHKRLEADLLLLVSKLPAVEEADPRFSTRLIQALSAADALSISTGHDTIPVKTLWFSLWQNRDRFGALGSVLGQYYIDDGDGLKKRDKPKSETRGEDVLLFSVSENINDLIKDNKITQIYDRGEEVSRLVQVLSRQTCNNPLLIGEPGVGRTFIVYALAKRIIEQRIPSHLIGKEILAIDFSALLAGTTLRGQFEERIQKLIRELTERQGQYILFVRDLSLLMGTGGEGISDAANLLKPALARGSIQLIGLVTPGAYKKRIETDTSFARFFQPLWISAPKPAECEQILLSLKDGFERFHGVFIEDDAVRAAIELGSRHLSGRVLPALAFDLLDEASSLHRIEIDRRPGRIVQISERLMKKEIELKNLVDRPKRSVAKIKRLTKEVDGLKIELARATEEYHRELAIVESMRAIQEELYNLRSRIGEEKWKGDLERAADLSQRSEQHLVLEFKKRESELNAITDRFIDPFVKRDDIAAVISLETGIPVSKMLASERDKLARMEAILGLSVIGQGDAISAVANAIRRARVGLKDEKKPIGSFLFLGPTGVGKTELARSLTNFLFDDVHAMVRFDMSEFMERHSVARLIGAPPGYQGSEEGGQLTEKVRRKPYSVVLFDEIEKAHSDILNVLLQVLDEGRLTDSKGQLVDFSNTVIIMTSNIGAEVLLQENYETDKNSLRDLIMDRLLHHLRPELINRIDEIVIFNPLDRQDLIGIADLLLNSLAQRLRHEGFSLVVEKPVIDYLVFEGYSREFGARPLKRAIQRLLENPLAMAMVKDGFNNGDEIRAVIGEGDRIYFEVVNKSALR